LGARVVDPSVETVRVSIHDEPRIRKTVLGSHGKLAQAAVEVFQAIRAGVFDSVQTISGQLIGAAAPGIAA
jgi:hypothetical protein